MRQYYTSRVRRQGGQQQDDRLSPCSPRAACSNPSSSSFILLQSAVSDTSARTPAFSQSLSALGRTGPRCPIKAPPLAGPGCSNGPESPAVFRGLVRPSSGRGFGRVGR
ncbi:hypothetical protein SKAU_G00363300 [Synaphobranchus kaupii]|uniref:Uncharacterized protein n=1 Tax=Synaphobranchus kaupii TaxID=118154 RepID=A0A9Q1EIM9_SYNKA|nr:hypothetical protein SKAU_G00363300 [Synaphobranchus kaupii]